MKTLHTFDCARTCRTHERGRDLCRFLPMLAAMGTVGPVTSHTTTLKVELRSHSALGAAALQLGGTVLGDGRHSLYGANSETGFAVKLPGWAFPIVLREDGKLAFDTYGNRGNAAGVADLTRAYVLAAAREAAAGQGWMVVEETPQAVTIAHPSGGRLTVKADGTCDAVGFCGTDCHATAPIEQAIGSVAGREFKDEYYDASTGRLVRR